MIWPVFGSRSSRKARRAPGLPVMHVDWVNFKEHKIKSISSVEKKIRKLFIELLFYFLLQIIIAHYYPHRLPSRYSSLETVGHLTLLLFLLDSSLTDLIPGPLLYWKVILNGGEYEFKIWKANFLLGVRVVEIWYWKVHIIFNLIHLGFIALSQILYRWIWSKQLSHVNS